MNLSRMCCVVACWCTVFCSFQSASEAATTTDVTKIGKHGTEAKFYYKADKTSEFDVINAIKTVNIPSHKVCKTERIYTGKRMRDTGKFLVVAKVNKSVITNVDILNAIRFIFFSSGKQFDKKKAGLMVRMVLEREIDRKLQEEVASKNKMEISEHEINERIKEIADRNELSVEELAERFVALGINMEIFKKNIASNMRFATIVEAMKSDIRISPDEVLEYKKQDAEERKQTRYRIFEIHFNAPDKKTRATVLKNAQSALELATEGFDFKTMSEYISQGNYSVRVGDLGWIGSKNIEKAVLDAAQKLKIGGLSSIIDVKTGFKIIYLEDKAEPGKKGSLECKYKYAKVSLQYRGGLMTTKDSEKINEVVEKLRAVKNIAEFKNICRKNNIDVAETEDREPQQFMREIFDSSVAQPTIMQSATDPNFVDIYYTAEKEVPDATEASDREIRNILLSKKVAREFSRNFKQVENVAFIKIDDAKLTEVVCE